MATSGFGKTLPICTEDCSGRTFIVTGSNTGIGYETVKRLLLQNASRVIMTVRNPAAGEKAKAELEAATGKTGVAQVWHLDLASYDSVKGFANKVISELDRVDVLIENAGVSPVDRTMAEGHHLTVTVNILSTFLLTMLLLPKLSETARKFNITPHIVILGSSYGFYYLEAWDAIKDDPLAKLDAEEKDISQNYPLSKLIDILFVRQLGPKVPVSQTGVVINVICPGLCRTDLTRDVGPEFQKVMEDRYVQYGRTAEEGSRCSIHAAFAGPGSHGAYLDSCKNAEDQLPASLTNEEGKKSSERIWEVVTKELEKIEPGCVERALTA